MEGILILKLYLGNNAVSPESLLTHIRDSLKEEGYVNPGISLEESYIIHDTLFMKIRLYNLHPFIPSGIILKGYVFSYPLFHALRRKFFKRKIDIASLRKEVKKLDRFAGTRSVVEEDGDVLIIQNREPPHLSGNVAIGDSITGSVRVDMEMSGLYISRNRVHIRLGAGLPFTIPSAIMLDYQKETTTYYRLILSGYGWGAGISYNAARRKPGPYVSINVPIFTGYAEYSDGWNIRTKIDAFNIHVRSFYSSRDSTFVGGMEDIIGFPENALKVSRYLTTGVDIPLYKGLSLTGQVFWMEDGRMNSAAGLKISSRYVDVMIAKGGGQPPILHIKVRN